MKKSKKKRKAQIPPKGHKVKVVYKYADEKPFVDRPKTTAYPPEKPLIKGDAFLKEYIALCVKYLKDVKKKSQRTLALCQIQDRSHVFIDAVKPGVLKALGWEDLK